MKQVVWLTPTFTAMRMANLYFADKGYSDTQVFMILLGGSVLIGCGFYALKK